MVDTKTMILSGYKAECELEVYNSIGRMMPKFHVCGSQVTTIIKIRFVQRAVDVERLAVPCSLHSSVQRWSRY